MPQDMKFSYSVAISGNINSELIQLNQHPYNLFHNRRVYATGILAYIYNNILRQLSNIF